LSGPGVRRGYTIESPVSLLDSAPTLAHLLNLPLPPGWVGRAITEVLE
jgi:arylsulfatase A-like enzyme